MAAEDPCPDPDGKLFTFVLASRLCSQRRAYGFGKLLLKIRDVFGSVWSNA